MNIPLNGLTVSELVRVLWHEGFTVTYQQLRKYELPGIVCPYRDPKNRYRMYSAKDCVRIRTIVGMRRLGLSLKIIKEFLDLKDYLQGNKSPNVEKVQQFLDLRTRVKKQLDEVDNNFRYLEERLND